MTVTYLRGGLSACSVVWLFVSFFFVYKIVDATVQKFLLKALKTTAHTFFSRSRLSFRASFRECGLVALVFDSKF